MRMSVLLALGFLMMGCDGGDKSSDDVEERDDDDDNDDDDIDDDDKDDDPVHDKLWYDCECDASFEDDVSDYEDTVTLQECLNPDELIAELLDVVDDCVDYFEDDGYKNVFCDCGCTPTSDPC